VTGGTTDGPLLSVVMISFNQGSFIRQAIESVLAQRTDFTFEVIVADDASTDGTAETVREIAEAHQDVISPVLRPDNVGIHVNLTDALGRARGRYIALCEGDDYWTDPSKLQRQVAFLEANPATSVCFHPVRVVWEDSAEPDEVFPTPELTGDLSLDHLLAGNFIQTNSVVYRRLARYDDVPDVMPLDWYLHIRHALDGEISMLPECMAVYRRHPGGVWFDSVSNHTKFWTAQGAGHAAFYEALLDLVGVDPGRRATIAELARRVLVDLTRIEVDEAAPSPLLDVIRRFPRWAEAGALRLSSDRDAVAGELALSQKSVEELSGALDDARDEIARLEERVERQRERVRTQRRRIRSLRKRLDAARVDLEATRARLPRARLRRLARGLVPRSARSAGGSADDVQD